MGFIEGAIAGVVFGVFCPAIARKIKALFVKEGNAVKAKVPAEITKTLKLD